MQKLFFVMGSAEAIVSAAIGAGVAALQSGQTVVDRSGEPVQARTAVRMPSGAVVEFKVGINRSTSFDTPSLQRALDDALAQTAGHVPGDPFWPYYTALAQVYRAMLAAQPSRSSPVPAGA